jgi:hypothetical protein
MRVKTRAPKMNRVNKITNICRFSPPMKIRLNRDVNRVLGFLSIYGIKISQKMMSTGIIIAGITGLFV